MGSNRARFQRVAFSFFWTKSLEQFLWRLVNPHPGIIHVRLIPTHRYGQLIRESAIDRRVTRTWTPIGDRGKLAEGFIFLGGLRKQLLLCTEGSNGNKTMLTYTGCF